MHEFTGNHGVAERLEQLAREAGKTMEEISLLEETAGSLFEKFYMYHNVQNNPMSTDRRKNLTVAE